MPELKRSGIRFRDFGDADAGVNRDPAFLVAGSALLVLSPRPWIPGAVRAATSLLQLLKSTSVFICASMFKERKILT
jgi:hypothetical protein